MELRLAGMDDLPQLRAVFKEIIEPMIRNNVRIWDGIYNEVIADDMVLHEFGFEIPVPIY